MIASITGPFAYSAANSKNDRYFNAQNSSECDLLDFCVTPNLPEQVVLLSSESNYIFTFCR